MNNRKIVSYVSLNFISTAMRHDYCDYTGEIWNQFEKIYSNYKLSFIKHTISEKKITIKHS